MGEPKVWDYARGGNPTRAAFEGALAALEGGARGFAFGSAAWPPSRRCCSRSARATTSSWATTSTAARTGCSTKVLGPWGLTHTTVDLGDLDALASAFTERTRFVWFESPSNPWLKIVDIAAVAAVAHAAGARVVVDNTFASPALQRPLELGADVVVHSVTKYIGGHSDLIGGAIVTSDGPLAEQLAFLTNAVGAIPGPMDVFLALRGLQTLGVRMRRHSENAAIVAAFLDDHEMVNHVDYPGLAAHPGHDVAARQMEGGFGGMVSFRVDSPERAAAIATGTELFLLAESLGGVESLIEVPGPMTHASVAGSDLEVPDDLIRLSVGLEHPGDLVADLDRALRA